MADRRLSGSFVASSAAGTVRLGFYRLAAAALAVSGVAQMPIFKRYYIADIPGMAWTGDFLFTHALHYAAAAALLFWLGWRLAARGAASLGRGRLALLGLLALTGGAHVLSNLPGVSLSPLAAMLLDWTHLGAAMALGIAALAMVFNRRSRTNRR
ncbi:hypothetical protein NNJEOMEG_00237 [Fundidesulfovibrio magnetotacticus]|uniref:Iron-sulfur cluster-binding protein n=1 Tax=Fundidesulfovibrio magnetotacticus TaxID=2730080 RepID=A0A6V8LI55_9BACT|nr:hypothetical protein [Fundidesulfovibrio magnetotacticus]GFK92412.1 hypothetical protein NNJEOMEG_00237 [Fundidesulfovibrio magnetotacticus]